MNASVSQTYSMDTFLELIRDRNFAKENLTLFEENGLEPVRRACLKALKDSSISGQLQIDLERIARSLVAQNDPLWREFLEMYLFCSAPDETKARTLRFVLDVWPESDTRGRSKAICGRLSRALYYHQQHVWTAGRMFVESELRAFYEWVQDNTFYGQEEWYRFERAVKLALKAQDPWFLDTMRLIKKSYSVKKSALRVLWEATDETEFPVLRAMHVAFLGVAIETLNKVHRTKERQLRRATA